MLYSAWLGVKNINCQCFQLGPDVLQIFMIFPNYIPITAAFMNYALPINMLVYSPSDRALSGNAC